MKRVGYRMSARRDFQYFNQYECHKGFYNDEDCEGTLSGIHYSDFNELPSIEAFPFDNAEVLLRGACNCFALSLQKVLNYSTFVIEEKNGKGFHVFCQIYRDKSWYFFDARGITSSFREFMNGLEVFIHDEFTIRPVTPEDKQRWESGDYYYKEGYMFAEEVIREYRECYIL